jgi:hypothetical protein|tara:strand:+ start:51554 stop:52186 length:633 start_codon:yes stop_codon:yes gene_type:complete
MPYALLTPFGEGFDLPVVRTVTSIERLIHTEKGRTVRVNNLHPEDRKKVGWYPFQDSDVGSDQQAGVPHDEIVNGGVVRTYPNQTTKPADQLILKRVAELDGLAADYLQNRVIDVSGDLVRTDPATLSVVAALSAAARGSSPTDRLVFKTVGGFALLTETQLAALYQAMGDHLDACYTNQRTHQLAIEALVSGDDVLAYDLTTGWPPVAP